MSTTATVRAANPLGDPILVDGGYSGQVTVICARPDRPDVNPDMIIVDVEHTGLYLSEAEAHELGMALVRAADRLRRERTA